MKSEVIETERLILRPLALSDAADLHLVYSDAETMRFWNTPSHSSIQETLREVESALSGAGCSWVICLHRGGPTIGSINYIGNPGVPGIGYILHRDYWRQGYGTEALRAIVSYGFNELNLDRAELWIHEDNVASQQLAQKVGFSRKGQFRTKWPIFPQSHEMHVYGLPARDGYLLRFGTPN